MKKRLITIAVALVLILVIGGIAVGRPLYHKYSYSKELADWNEFYQVSGEESAIILQNEMVEEKALIRDQVCYFDLDTIHKYMNEIFYVDPEENLLLYTDAVGTTRVNLGESVYTGASGAEDMGCTIAFCENDKVYVAADYVQLFTNYSYEVFDRHVQVYTQWGEHQTAEIKKATALRTLGGIKSPILCELAAGDPVEILEEMETWSKVKTSDSVIGYVENKRLANVHTEAETAVDFYEAPEYTSVAMDGKVSLGFHAVYSLGGNESLGEVTANAHGMNVIAPTWFALNDNEGGYRSFGSSDYVARAHGMGLQVWGVVDNFNSGVEVDELAVLSSTAKRQRLVDSLAEEAGRLGLDGINVDFESLDSKCGIHYVQFLRELSVACRQKGLVLSVDNYVPFDFNDYYRLDIQGQIADYVIIMGYDEHWHGCGEAGSVASLSYVSNGLDRTLEEVPSQKVVNALPFYTRIWRTEGDQVTDETLFLNQTADYLSRRGVAPVWDETTGQNYAEWQEGSTLCQVWVEDAQSISAKLNVMEAKELGGVAVWRLGFGNSAIWDLLKVYVSL